MINILFFVLYFLVHPKLWKLLLKRVYLPVYVQYAWLEGNTLGTFIDIGAHKGTVSKVVHHIFPQAKIFAFEPIKNFANAIKAVVPGSTVIAAAVGDKDGMTKLHVTKYAPASSIRPFVESLSTKFITNNDIETQIVQLDTYFKNKNLKHPVFLKIDVQGYEREVLTGAKQMLDSVDIIHIESTLTEVYKGQALFHEIHEVLSRAGFEYRGALADGEFIPKFSPEESQNSIYIRS